MPTEIVADRDRQDKVAIRQALHQRTGPQPVSPVVGKIGLADRVQSGQIGHQIIIHPQPTHRVMDGRVNPHRHLVGTFVGDALVHLEQVFVTRFDDVVTMFLDGIAKIKIDTITGRTDAEPFVANILGITGSHIARYQVAKAGISFLKVVEPILFRNLIGPPCFIGIFRDPDASVVSQRLAHQRQLRLIITRSRNGSWMDLREARIGKTRATLVRTVSGSHVASFGIGRQIIDVAVSTGGQHNRIGGMRRECSRFQISHDDSAGATVDNDQVHHFRSRMHANIFSGDLLFQRRVSAEQQLLPCLTATIKSSLDQYATKRAVGQFAAVLAGEWNALGNRLINDRGA